MHISSPHMGGMCTLSHILIPNPLVGEESEFVPVTSGVPQGSVLGPILFLIFIDDMPQYTKHSQTRLFADDTIVYLTVSDINDCGKLQEDLKRLEK